MLLDLDKLEKSLPVEHVYSLAELSWEDESVRLCGPVELKAQARRPGREIHLTGHLAASVEADCDRCLAPVRLSLTPELEAVYVTLADYPSGDTEALSRDDLRLAVYDGVTLDIADLVREQLLLALPGQILCRPECLGICPQCGKNRNQEMCACAQQPMDPRWAALRNFKPA